jgi:acyl carrier protein
MDGHVADAAWLVNEVVQSHKKATRGSVDARRVNAHDGRARSPARRHGRRGGSDALVESHSHDGDRMEDQIRRFISDTFFVDNFAVDASFLKNGIIDSTGVLELVAFLEETFAIKVEDTDLVPENLDSIAQVIAFVQRKQA